MKMIVDVPDNVYAKVMEYSEHNEIIEAVYGYIYRGTPIPDNATNGDVIKAIFGNNVFVEDEYEDEDGVTWTDMISDNGMTFEMDFWNAPYQKGGK